MGKNADPVKTRYSNNELSEFQKIIEEKLIEAKKQLMFYKNQLSEMADNPDTKVKGLDDGLSTVENERLSSMALRMQKHIQHLENAKLRIQKKVKEINVCLNENSDYTFDKYNHYFHLSILMYICA
jgi:di/tripeptidase